MRATEISLWIVGLCLAALAPPLMAGQSIAGDYGLPVDPYWQKRMQEADKAVHEAYHPIPEHVTNSLNTTTDTAVGVAGSTIGGVNSTASTIGGVNSAASTIGGVNSAASTIGGVNSAAGLPLMNNTRRGLRKRFSGPCKAFNVIDQCWRCRPDWEVNRKRLSECAMGFGGKAIGGRAGRIYVVNSPVDDPVNPAPGTLRHAVIQKEPLWIVFSRKMIITLKEELVVANDKTIDARGADVRIAYGAGITLQSVTNVIIHGLHIHDIIPTKGGNPVAVAPGQTSVRGPADGDGITVFQASNIWLDHLSMARCSDGLIDIVFKSTAVTISNCHFTDHNDVMLFGGNDAHDFDKIMQVTLAFNHFGRGLVQRMPRCRYGFFHIVNNDYHLWQMYAIGGSMNPTIISQGNRYIAPNTEIIKEVTGREGNPRPPPNVWQQWRWRSEGDLMINGAFFVQSGSPLGVPVPGMIKAMPGTMANQLTLCAGSLTCFPNKPC